MTERVRIRRVPKRAAYDRATINAILGEAQVCHLGFVHNDQPYVIPTLHARVRDRLYVHGSAASRQLGALADGAAACVTMPHRSHDIPRRDCCALGELGLR